VMVTQPELYVTQLDLLLGRFEADLDTLGHRIRKEVIIPACKKHDLSFYSRSGDFYFAKGKATCGSVSDPFHDKLSDAALETVRPILKLLNMETSHGQYLGYKVASWTRRRARATP
jgi:hypothetical protein